MKFKNLNLLMTYRQPGKCRWCGKHCQMRCAHHIFSKSAGRVDIPPNLIALGMSPLTDCACHMLNHNGEITKEGFLAMSAADYGCSQDDIRDFVYLIRRLDRDTTKTELFDALARCRPSVRDLARRTI